MDAAEAVGITTVRRLHGLVRSDSSKLAEDGRMRADGAVLGA